MDHTCQRLVGRVFKGGGLVLQGIDHDLRQQPAAGQSGRYLAVAKPEDPLLHLATAHVQRRHQGVDGLRAVGAGQMDHQLAQPMQQARGVGRRGVLKHHPRQRPGQLGGVQAVAPKLLQIDAWHRTGRRPQGRRSHQCTHLGVAQQRQGFRDTRHLAGHLQRGRIGQLQQARSQGRIRAKQQIDPAQAGLGVRQLVHQQRHRARQARQRHGLG